jgi:hypothetical protein
MPLSALTPAPARMKRRSVDEAITLTTGFVGQSSLRLGQCLGPWQESSLRSEGKLRRFIFRIARYLVVFSGDPPFNNYSPDEVARRFGCTIGMSPDRRRRGHASPCFSPPTLPPQRKGRMRIDGRSGLRGCGFHCDAEATNLPVKLDVLIIMRSLWGVDAAELVFPNHRFRH